MWRFIRKLISERIRNAARLMRRRDSPGSRLDMVQQFAKRRNPDGTMDSICLNCFRTVATSTDELKLIEFERDHQCRESRATILAFPPDRMIENRSLLEKEASAGKRPARTEKPRERIRSHK